MKQAKESGPNGLKVIRLMNQGLPTLGITKWPRAGDRRRLDPKPLTVTVQGVNVYKREYQEHSDAAEAAWRQQDKEEEEKEKEEERRNVAGAGFYRILCESMPAVDAKIEAYGKREKKKKKNVDINLGDIIILRNNRR